MWSFVYHTYLVQIPYISRTPIFQLETVPYTNRIHFVIRSPLDDREYAESCFAFVRKNHSSKFLSPLHPDSVRVNLITAQLLRAVQRGLDIKNRDVALIHESSCKDVSLDARHAIESKKQGKLCKSQSQTAHLDGLAWEVIVVKNDRHVGAMSWPHGKIIVFTGLLIHLKTDAEIATALSHDIAHVVARHSSESIVYKKWFPFPLMVHFLRRFILLQLAQWVKIAANKHEEPLPFALCEMPPMARAIKSCSEKGIASLLSSMCC
ncbi:mitochondrial metalloendopeptidase OMA1 isoform X2 [Triticum aestivum]|uniref:mitochondrial metalloendopeptidase OMA1 isoform X2 n=1 Tax=Triticum aestivum TaxID=4565 RepID=UPI001D010838|nr:mitochondrial metalloendopeptidase OMA1-like isoform X2 [Triticum aestivum]